MKRKRRSFYKPIAAYYEEIFPLKEPKISFIRSFLKKEPFKILDIGCATGQLAMALAGEGHEVAGIDLDRVMIERAKKDAAEHGLKVDFMVMNMMDINTHFNANSFDMVLCLGNTMVHLESLEEIGRFIKKVYNLLKKQGEFIVQVVNYDAVLGKGIKELPIIDTEHVRFERRYVNDKTAHKIRFCSRLIVKETMESVENEVFLYPLTKGELVPLLKDAGFGEMDYYGNFQKEAHTTDSPALIAAARSNIFAVKMAEIRR